MAGRHGPGQGGGGEHGGHRHGVREALPLQEHQQLFRRDHAQRWTAGSDGGGGYHGPQDGQGVQEGHCEGREAHRLPVHGGHLQQRSVPAPHQERH